ncbi:arylsulfatase [Cryobacterium tagatosivorans]|nr:arylsulfatase [Cryobacterium tagatosivorans]
MTNVILILADDMGFSDLGSFGGEIATPNLDRLAGSGLRLSQFYNTARCSPSRASLLTGRHPHETGIGILNDDDRPWGYPGTLSRDHATAAEHFKAAGYATCLSGKWHLSSDTTVPNDSWPTRRGFDDFYGILGGAGDYFHPRELYRGEARLEIPGAGYYFTDAVSEHAAGFVRTSAAASTPFFLYLAYTAPHWPLHAPADIVDDYDEVYARGWDELRSERRRRLVESGILGSESTLSDRDPSQTAWDDAADHDWEARRMSVYAAQVDSMDRGIGTVLDAVEAAGLTEDTLVVFLSDNGACAESMPPADAPLFRQRQPSHAMDGRPMRIGNEPDIVPGPADTYASYGTAWANLSNTPFRYYKRWVHEGGIATPFIASWPAGGLADGSVVAAPFQLTNVLPTLLDAAGLSPAGGPGSSMLPVWRGGESADDHALYWEHVGNAAIRMGRWKSVRTWNGPWELYDMSVDRAELNDLSQIEAALLEGLVAQWQAWADSVGVIPWTTVLEHRAERAAKVPPAASAAPEHSNRED